MALFDKKLSERSPRPKSPRPAVNTYYRSESKAADSPFVKKPPKRPARKFVLGFLDVLVLAALLVILFYALALKPDPAIEANDFSYHSKAAYSAAASAQFSRFKNHNKVTFDESAVVKSLQTKFPEITAVQVELPFFSEQPVLRLTIAKPDFVLDSPESSLVVDSAGVAVAPVADVNVKGLPVINDNSGYIAKAGSQALSSDSASFINTLIAQCKHAKVPIASLTLPAAPQELQLRTKDSAYYVKFYLGGNVMQETGQYLAARAHFTQTHQPPAEYLDVRVPGKIFYK